VLFWLAGAIAAPAGLGEEPPGFYELTARSDLVVSARVVAGALKRAKVEVVETFRGEARKGEMLEIEFRYFNSGLSRADRIVFPDGEAVLLFLTPELSESGRPKGKGRYTLHRGRFGIYTLPREGAEAYLDALREFAALAALKDHRELFRRLGNLLGSSNPLLVDAGLEEVHRLGLMEPRLFNRVTAFLQDPSPRRRREALEILADWIGTLPPERRAQDLRDDLLGMLETAARNDPEEEVRAAAVSALGSWGGDSVEPTLRVIARGDPSQAVRYRAEVILLRAEGKRETENTEEGPDGP
jgi:HEAT repeat protein